MIGPRMRVWLMPRLVAVIILLGVIFTDNITAFSTVMMMCIVRPGALITPGVSLPEQMDDQFPLSEGEWIMALLDLALGIAVWILTTMWSIGLGLVSPVIFGVVWAALPLMIVLRRTPFVSRRTRGAHVNLDRIEGTLFLLPIIYVTIVMSDLGLRLLSYLP